ncbi:MULTISPECIES: hypothetical protein [unclassified Pedobacter]|uniref:hypothetical protein n=1 Tax=unclassified Pedobacter TaxID=2628915 RepID=UPI00141DF9E4|nr:MULTISPECIES: hypothetical protein [unclassified Pedobacter]NII85490.1 hypothetical protein [Pedobacter sp. SG908]NMN39593.1 hypothetical protein [Pedobacter sp. SG918]
MKKKCLLLFLLCATVCARAQVTPSGNAKIVEQLMDHQISYSTGRPNIQIPLYEIDFAGMKIPISLNYGATGLALGQMSGPVGAGWSLSTNYQISRTVRGRPDELYQKPSFDGVYLEKTQAEAPQAYMPGALPSRKWRDVYLSKFMKPDVANGDAPTSIYNSELYQLDSEILDSESDIFRYTALNYSGRFIFVDRAPNFTVQQLDENNFIFNLKYYKGSAPSEGNFFIANDINGNRYEFRATQGSVATNVWSLSNVRSKSGDTLKFNYDYQSITNKAFGEHIYVKEGCRECLPYNNSIPNYFRRDTAKVVDIASNDKLYSIDFPEGHLMYSYDNTVVNGINEVLLKELQVLDWDQNLVRKIKFIYQVGTRYALLSTLEISGGSEEPLVYNFNYNLSNENNQLLDEIPMSPNQWGYISGRNNVTGSTKKESVPFGDNVPILSIFDPNGNGLSPLSPTSHLLSWFISPLDIGSAYEVSTHKPKYMLSEITNPFGGKTTYEFENNVAYNSITNGYRIREIKQTDGAGNYQRKTYTYGDNDDDTVHPDPLGSGYVSNSYFATPLSNYIRQGVEIGVLPDNLGDPSNWMLFNTYNINNQSEAEKELAGINENGVYYNRVTERIYNGQVPLTKIEFVFDTAQNIVEAAPYTRNLSPLIAGRGTISRQYVPMAVTSVMLGYRPELKEKNSYVFINGTWKKQLKEEYKYRSFTPENYSSYKNLSISNFAIHNQDYTAGMGLEDLYSNTNIDSIFDFHFYDLIITGPRKLLNKTVTNYTE